MELAAMLGCPDVAFRQAEGEWEDSVTSAPARGVRRARRAQRLLPCPVRGRRVSAEDIKTLADMVKIPLLPVRMFKQPDAHVLMTAALTDVELEIRSTGTGGVPSVARRDVKTVSRVMTAIFAQYREFFQVGKGAGLFLCPSTAETPEMGMVKAFNVLNGLLDDHAYIVRDYAFDPEEALSQLDKWEESMTRHIIGPPFLVGRLLRYLELEDITLKLDPESLVITLGGWKRYTGESISREEFNAKIEKYLGIPATGSATCTA